MKQNTRYFGSSLVREIDDTEIKAVSGGVVMAPGNTTPTDTGTDNGYSCDADSDWVMNMG